MNYLLVVPIYLDALVLDKPTAMVEAFADFSRLPHFNGERDINPDVPNISEEILSQPFQNQNLYLERGVHLHWALPDALARGRREQNGKTEFPAVPNRWLITRIRTTHQDQKSQQTVEAQWVVESDYLFDPTELEKDSLVSNQVINYPYKDSHCPFRYVGRVRKLDKDWEPSVEDSVHQLEKLTAVGYGEPAFAAFYPNSFNVFGFHDSDPVNLNNLTYEVIGWYSNGRRNGGQLPLNDRDWDFQFADILNWDKVVDQLNQDRGKSNTLVGRIYNLLGDSIKAMLSQAGQNLHTNDQKILIAEFNRILKLKELYQKGIFQLPSIRDVVVTQLLRKDSSQWSGKEVLRINRLLIEAAFSPCIAPLDWIEATKNLEKWSVTKEIKKESFVSLLNAGKDSQNIWDELIKKDWLYNPSEGMDSAWIKSRDERAKIILSKFTDLSPKISDALDDFLLSQAPERFVCFAQITFNETKSRTSIDVPEVAIGNTSTEALSAYLAKHLTSDDKLKSITEDQLEALYLTSGLKKHSLDIGPKFKEARHTKGFRPVPAGYIWTLRPESSPLANQKVNRSEQVTLPVELAELLNSLNEAQQAYDRANFEIDSLRSQLFADWYKYMLCAYPPLDTPDDYPNIDEVKRFIEVNYLDDQAPLQQKMGKVGKLYASEADSVGQPVLWADQPGKNLADEVVQAVNNLLDSTAMSNLQKVAESDIGDWKGFAALLDQSTLLTNKYSSLPETQIDPIARENKIAELLEDLNNLVFKKHPDSSQDLCLTVEDAWKRAKDAQKEPKNWNDLTDNSNRLINTLKINRHLPAHAWTRLNRLLLESLFPQFIAHRPDYILKRIPAPRYWEPNDPVVLLAGDIVKPTNRHGPEGELQENGLLQCAVISSDTVAFDSSDGLKAVRKKIQEQAGKLGLQLWTEQPWNPIMLEWEVEFFPTEQGNNLNSGNLAYNMRFIDSNYKLPKDACGFSNVMGKGIVQAANLYSGRSILTPHAKNQLNLQLDAFLNNDKNESLFKDIVDVYKGVNNILKNTNVLAQSLGGFNQALLMHKQTLQLPVTDPLGFEDYRKFTEDVRIAVGNNNRSAPQPLNNFNPIRAGHLKILRLRLIDTFGQVREIDCSHMITADTMPRNDHRITLYPRLSQPARLNFRWLAADITHTSSDEAEMNDHPATSPICGWILPNNLDGSLMIYEPKGRALGSLDQNAMWHPAPGRSTISIWDIPNTHLRKLINYISKQEENFIKDFLGIIENALEKIDPENFAQHEALALLMGRPIAVVRASLNLELRGRAAINQDWNIFRQDMQGTTTEKDWQGIDHLVRTTDGFTGVTFPIRIGEYNQLNDGLVGYWLEDEDGYSNDMFYAPQTSNGGEGIDHPKIRIHRDKDPAMVYQSIDDPPHKLTMLLDPRGVVHATCGILPTKSIHIPSDQFAGALRAIEVTFFSAPILTDVGKINLPLPEEAGYEWSWLEKENGVWADESQIGPVTSQATFAAKQVIREGWLKLRRKPNGQNSNS